MTNAIEMACTVAEIGAIPGGKGRPQKVFAMTPVTKETLSKAKMAGINLVDNAEEKFVKVITVTNTAAVTTTAPTPSVPVSAQATH